MSNHEQYAKAIRRLAACGYTVRQDERGYFVLHQTDNADISRAPTLDDLLDLAELMEWAQQRSRWACR